MAKKPNPGEVDMVALNAKVSSTSMRLLRVATGVENRSIRDIVQDALDAYLKSRGITEEKFLGTDKHKRQ